jgi:hypothetical protein
MNNLSIGIDFDGVIADHTQAKLKMAKEAGFNIQEQDTHSLKFKNIVGEDIYSKIAKFIYETPEYSPSLMSNVDVVLKKLKQNNHSLFLISQRTNFSSTLAIKWLQVNLSGIFEKDKMFFVEDVADKQNICEKTGIDVFLDDRIKVLNSIKEARKFLFDQYKLFQNEDEKIQPVFSWDNFWEKINSIQL